MHLKNYSTWIAGLIVTVGLTIALYLAFYENAEECVYREVQILKAKMEEKRTSSGSGALYDTTDPKKVTSASKTIAEELDYSRLSTDGQHFYIAVRAILDSCGVEYRK